MNDLNSLYMLLDDYLKDIRSSAIDPNEALTCFLIKLD